MSLSYFVRDAEQDGESFSFVMRHFSKRPCPVE